jgi:hypothetical protein
VVRNRDNNGVNLFVVEQLFIPSRGLYGFSDNFTRQFVTAIVEIASGYAFDAGELDSSCQQLGALHANPYNSKANTITGRDRLRGCVQRFRIQESGSSGEGSTHCSRSRLQELTSRETNVSHEYDLL